MLSRALLAALFGSVTLPVRADVKLHPLFTDNMVIQQGVTVPVVGIAEPGEDVTVTFTAAPEFVGRAKADDRGRFSIPLPASKPGTDFTLTVKGNNEVTLANVAVGEVWVCSGQSNMEWSVNASYDADKTKAAGKNPNIRLFTVQKKTAKAPVEDQNEFRKYVSKSWEECSPDTVGRFSAVAYFFGANLQKSLGVPVGLIHTSWGGTPAEAWTSREALEAESMLKYYAANSERAIEVAGDKSIGQNVPSGLYNAMIHPLLSFPIRGAIWYQGESNAGKAFEYRTLFPAMIRDWRGRWGHEFPFLCVQLAPFNAGDADGVAYAELRDAQLHATKVLPNVGMAVITDAGDLFDIHPRDKATPGNRLAIAARSMVYGEDIAPGGPEFQEMKVDGSKAILTFTRTNGGLVGRYGPRDSRSNGAINGFEVCGEDKLFLPAKAKIEGETVVVWSDRVEKPVAVRFGWKNYPVVNLYARQNLLPASPFRTDDFPLTTQPKKREQ